VIAFVKAMSVVGDITSRSVGAGIRSPKTILGFFALVLGIAVVGAAVAIRTLAQTTNLHNLVLPILMFTGGLVIFVIVAVLAIALIDPTKLMLGEISDEAYIENRKLSLGDSLHGEQVELVQVSASPSATAALPAAVQEDDQN